MGTVRRTLIALALVAGLVAACSGSAATVVPPVSGTPAGGTQSGPTQTGAGVTTKPTTGAPKLLDACSLITSGEAAAALGEPVDPGVVPTPGAHSCLFAGHPAQGIDANSVEISITSVAGFDPTKKSITGLTIAQVSGVGDAAYSVSMGSGYIVLNVRKGQNSFTTSVLRKKASDAELLSAEKALAVAVLGRI